MVSLARIKNNSETKFKKNRRSISNHNNLSTNKEALESKNEIKKLEKIKFFKVSEGIFILNEKDLPEL